MFDQIKAGLTREAALCLWWRSGQSMRIRNCSDTPRTLPKPEKHKHRHTKLHNYTNTHRQKHKHSRDSNYTQVAMWSVSEELELAAPPTYFAPRLFIIHCFTLYTWPVVTRQQYIALYLLGDTLLLLAGYCRPDNTMY